MNEEFVEFTGERIIPELENFFFLEHLARYKLAKSYLNENDKILDVGCGDGYGTFFLSRFAGHATGIDVSNETINLAAKKYTKNNLGYLCVDPNEWGLPKSAFDFVTCFEVFEHINQPELLLEKIHYCLKPGGKLIISTPNKNVFGENIKVSFHVKEYTMEEFTAILQNIFDICEIKGQYHLKKIGRKWNYFISDLAMRFPVLLKIVSYYLSKKPRKYLNPEYFDHLDTSDNIFSKHAPENADYFVVVCSKGT